MADLTDYVILPGVDYKDACDAVREKTGKSEGIPSGALAAEIRGIAPKLQEKAASPTTAAQTVQPDDGYDGLSKVSVAAMKLQEKAASPTTAAQTVQPDDGYDGLSKVSVAAMKLQEKAASPTTAAQTVQPDDGYDGLSKVSVAAMKLQKKTVSPGTTAKSVAPDADYDGLSAVDVSAIRLESKSVTPTSSAQTVVPSSGYDGLSQVTVQAAEGGAPAMYTITLNKTGSLQVRVFYKDHVGTTNHFVLTDPQTISVRANEPFVVAVAGNATKSITSSFSSTFTHAVVASKTYSLKDGTYQHHKIFMFFTEEKDGYVTVTTS